MALDGTRQLAGLTSHDAAGLHTPLRGAGSNGDIFGPN